MRILLFLATNLAVIFVASFTLRLLGVDSYLAQNGIQYGSLLAFATVFGFAGAIVSLIGLMFGIALAIGLIAGIFGLEVGANV